MRGQPERRSVGSLKLYGRNYDVVFESATDPDWSWGQGDDSGDFTSKRERRARAGRLRAPNLLSSRSRYAELWLLRSRRVQSDLLACMEPSVFVHRKRGRPK